MNLHINGKLVPLDVDPAMPLLWVLRDELNLTGTKFGCGIAACGACTVPIDAAMTNLCRCGTYQRVRAAIHRSAKNMANVGAMSSADRPPLGARAPSGGSAAREAANMGAMS